MRSIAFLCILIACLSVRSAIAQGPVPVPPPAGPAPTPAPAAPAATERAATEPAATPPPAAPPGSQPAGESEAVEATGATGATPPAVLLVETQAVGIDPVVGRVANRRIRATVEALGYAPLDGERARTSMRKLGIGYPPSIADLWRLTYAARAERGVFAVVWASGGRYVAEVRVASRDGAGPLYARGESDAGALEAKLDALVREALPAPGAGTAPAAVATSASLAPAAEAAPPAPVTPRESTRAAKLLVASRPPPPSEEREPVRTWRFALQTEAAFGLAEDPFYVHLVGARAERAFGTGFSGGGFAAYANLPGRDGRVGSALTALQIEQRIALGDAETVSLPLRIALGYLWRNGPVLRLASGVAFALGEHTDLLFDLVTPTFWVTQERTLFSLDAAVEVGWRP